MRRRVRPRLEAAGFEDFTVRKAWRRSGDAIEVVDFQAVGAYAALGLGCTPFSFSVRAGVRYAECEGWDGDSAAYMARPGYQHCTFEIDLDKRLRQPHAFRPWGDGPPQDRADIWAVWEDASNVEDVVEDAAETLFATGMPLLAEFGSPDLAYVALLTRDSSGTTYGTPSVGMPGAPGSPRWTDAVRCLAVRLGRDADDDLASARVLDASRPSRLGPRGR
ncbi:MAG: hypothetical protein M3R02_31000 [Chloroflexota bacterium]|nr:hypothetical protein [Chloroflexota bacterium]